MLAVDECKGILGEERHVLGEMEGFMTEFIDVGELGCVCKLLHGPISVWFRDKLVCTSKHHSNWIIDQAQIVNWWSLLTILLHVLFGTIVKSAKPGVLMTNKLAKVDSVEVSRACHRMTEQHIPSVLLINIDRISISAFDLLVAEGTAHVAAKHIVLRLVDIIG